MQIDGTPYLQYESISQAAKSLECDSKTIRHVLDKEGTGKGLKWVTFDADSHANVPKYTPIV